ncbi:SRPBCC family protein [Mycobacterium manitobense]|uniref:SRPBCC family protein n=1 Tax=[Mycobacterium] manitobense TaxID=190147 RepID=A0A9X3BN11_9MYCO|nr:SRPBCC family protein [[Mycobacterium] manitobense]
MRVVSARHFIAAPIGEVFDWLADGRNWAAIPGMFYARVRPVDGPEPYGVGSIREFASSGSKVTELVTGFERPHFMSYQALSSIPPIQHGGGSMTFREVPGGTEIEWETRIRLESPVFAGALTAMYAPLVKLGFLMLMRTAARALS